MSTTEDMGDEHNTEAQGDEAQKVNQSETTDQADAKEQTAQPEPADSTKQEEKANEPLKDKWWVWLIVGVAVIFVLIMAGISISAQNSSNKAESSQTTFSQSSTSGSSSSNSQSSTSNSSGSSSNSSSSTTSNTGSSSTTSTSTSFTTTLSKLGSFEATTVTGEGDDVVEIPCKSMPCLMTITYDGDSNFAVWSVTSSGDNVDLLINTIGSYSGVVTDFKDYKNSAMLSIESSGPWSVTFAPMSSMQQATNGAEFSGDNVVYLDEKTLTKLTFSNSGDSNFIVHGIGMTSSKLLVNEIGDYSGTVVWNEPKSFLIVNSDGTWTVGW